MASETEVTIRGRLGNTPEIQTRPGKKPMTRLRVATNRRTRGPDGWVDGATSWYDVKLWGDFAQNAADSLRKGDAVLVQGDLFIEEYVNAAGVTMRSPVVHANALGPDLRTATARISRVSREQTADGGRSMSGIAQADPFVPHEPQERPERDDDAARGRDAGADADTDVGQVAAV